MITANLSLTDAATRIDGPLLFAHRRVDVGLNEAVQVVGADGQSRLGRIAALDEALMTVEILESTSGLSLTGTRIRFFAEPISFSLGPGILGRVFDGVGRVMDGGPPIATRVRMPVDGAVLNPMRRKKPEDFIETGVSTIDVLNSLVRGQKLPIFSGGGLPHNRLAIEIALHARLLRANAGEEERAPFAIVFAGIGVPFETAEFFRRSLEESGALGRTALFLNLASDSSTQRLLAPRFALTAAEYLAFVEGRHVLVIITDFTNYCEALREVSASHGEIPGRKGYPGYMYSDLATLYERAGSLQGRPGTLTQLPILTMPSDDISHPIPDLTGYITEGQITLNRSLDREGIYPPVGVLPSLSRLMKDGIGAGFTHPDHPALANQLYASYARATQVRLLANVVGSDGLTPEDRRMLSFGQQFERRFINQDRPRTLEESMREGWSLLGQLPIGELSRLNDNQIATYIQQGTE
ncbi:MAG: V-type ATP synthase subunit B [Magnetococcales bacterium]|nr:V-type ATP synthase subunit B [Magnetococcales bacterium]MBF0113890.1 V-type ATP synthase subunit B [Magnetococcales bacterium]